MAWRAIPGLGSRDQVACGLNLEKHHPQNDCGQVSFPGEVGRHWQFPRGSLRKGWGNKKGHSSFLHPSDFRNLHPADATRVRGPRCWGEHVGGEIGNFETELVSCCLNPVLCISMSHGLCPEAINSQDDIPRTRVKADCCSGVVCVRSGAGGGRSPGLVSAPWLLPPSRLEFMLLTWMIPSNHCP